MFVAVANSKGGVGKSTIAVHAAVWLRERGVRLAVVDADAQASTSEWLAQAAPGLRIERCETVAQLNERLPRLSAVYDVVLADGPAALSAETVVLAAAADLVLLPIGPSMMDVRASYRTARMLYNLRLRVHRTERPQVVTILNRVQPRTRLAQIAMEAVGKYGFPLARTCLCLRQAYAEACGKGTVVWKLGDSGRRAAIEIRRLFDDVLTVVPRTLPASAVVMPNTPVNPLAPTSPAPTPPATPVTPVAAARPGE
ncbi:MAG TPA: ParA family protein [Phycisphaerae bacterium]|nr:ParA family protein [Phycisphaerae bacterium]